MGVVLPRDPLICETRRLRDNRHRHTIASEPRAKSAAKVVERRALGFRLQARRVKVARLFVSAPAPPAGVRKDGLAWQLARRSALEQVLPPSR